MVNSSRFLCFSNKLALVIPAQRTHSFTRRRSKISRSFCHHVMLSLPTPRGRSRTRPAQSQQLRPVRIGPLEAATSFGSRIRQRSLNDSPNHHRLSQLSSRRHRHHGKLIARLVRTRSRVQAQKSRPMSRKHRPGRSHWKAHSPTVQGTALVCLTICTPPTTITTVKR